MPFPFPSLAATAAAAAAAEVEETEEAPPPPRTLLGPPPPAPSKGPLSETTIFETCAAAAAVPPEKDGATDDDDEEAGRGARKYFENAAAPPAPPNDEGVLLEDRLAAPASFTSMPKAEAAVSTVESPCGAVRSPLVSAPAAPPIGGIPPTTTSDLSNTYSALLYGSPLAAVVVTPTEGERTEAGISPSPSSTSPAAEVRRRRRAPIRPSASPSASLPSFLGPKLDTPPKLRPPSERSICETEDVAP